MKQSFMVCATYRASDKPSPLRYFGVLSLLEEAKAQTYDGDIRLAIVDSSPQPHPFFVHPEALLAEHGIAYIHVPSRDAAEDWRRRFPDASRFVPTNDDLAGPIWKKRAENMRDWDDFLLFDDNFKNAYTGPLPSAFMHMDRPAIGMKKNVGVAALAETFGAADNIIFCDDDDRHHPDYVAAVSRYLEDNDFARPGRWLTLAVGATPDKNVWGVYDIPFYADSNGNWRAPSGLLSQAFRSTMKNWDGSEFVRTIGEKFSPGMCTTFPPLSHDGALHSYRFDVWREAVDAFGGCGPTSMCEDMLFYRMCRDHLPGFKAARVDSAEPLFIRCADGTNASLIEWNQDLPRDHGFAWAQQAATEIYRNIRAPRNEQGVAAAGREFLKSGRIDWSLIFPEFPERNFPVTYPLSLTCL
jgi:hypothetical protein